MVSLTAHKQNVDCLTGTEIIIITFSGLNDSRLLMLPNFNLAILHMTTRGQCIYFHIPTGESALGSSSLEVIKTL